jgi:hypothetical protein
VCFRWKRLAEKSNRRVEDHIDTAAKRGTMLARFILISPSGHAKTGSLGLTVGPIHTSQWVENRSLRDLSQGGFPVQTREASLRFCFSIPGSIVPDAAPII